MLSENTKAVIQRFREALNAGDLDGAIAVFAPVPLLDENARY